jgi:hypothetical protein
MNDNELLTAVRESFTDVHSATPAEQILQRGRRVRAQRRVTVVAGALAVAAGAAVALTTLLASSQAAHQPAARLAAWTVIKQANGDIEVTINQLQDPAGLQSTLNADGVPASVAFSGQFNPACIRSGTPLSQSEFNSIITGQLQRGSTRGDAFTINPAAIPSGLGLQIASSTKAPGEPGYAIGFALIQASPQCTGIT